MTYRIDLETLNSNTGFQIIGTNNLVSQFGYTVSGIGDFNKDGFEDYIIAGKYYYNPKSYYAVSSVICLVYGGSSDSNGNGFTQDNFNGHTIYGPNTLDTGAGWALAPAGDINGDTYPDFIIGTRNNWYKENCENGICGLSGGRAYVLFGNSFHNDITLSDSLSKTGYGFTIIGHFTLINNNLGDHLGDSVSAAGDVNGDGIDDIIVGSYADVINGQQTGAAYVIFGKKTGFNDISTSDLISSANSNGFAIFGAYSGDFTGLSVSGGKDINGDALDDIIVSATSAKANGNDNAGIIYIIFGKNHTTSQFSNINLLSLSSTDGFQIRGAATNNRIGFFGAAAVGDMNGDGLSEIAISTINTGLTYIIFGRKSDFSPISLSHVLTTGKGIIINYAGSVFKAKDINKDGLADLIINHGSGLLYVIFGNENLSNHNPLNVSNMDNSQGFAIGGAFSFRKQNWGYYGFAAESDVNGDGYSDIIIDASNNTPYGSVYVVYGGNLPTFEPSLLPTIVSTLFPSLMPSVLPSSSPTNKPSLPTKVPTEMPSLAPTFKPTVTPTQVPKNGLVACYLFNGNANDESGNGNNGVVYSAVLTRDRFGTSSSSYLFEGNAYIKVIDGSQFNFVNEFSLSYWVKPLDNQQSYAAHFDKSHYTSSAWTVQKAEGFSNAYYLGYMQSSSGSWSNNYGHSYNIQIAANTWNHIAITKHDNEIKYYLNGILKTTEYTSSAIISTNGNLPLFIGAVNNNVIARFFKGVMDDIYIYRRTLTDEEIEILFVEFSPTSNPSVSPSLYPTISTTQFPTLIPSELPTVASPSTENPTITHAPTIISTHQPSTEPSTLPTVRPTTAPTEYKEFNINGGGTYEGTYLSENFVINSTKDVTITGGGGRDKFTIIQHSDVTVTITDFDKDNELIDISAFTNIHSIKDFTITYGSALINLPNNQVIKLLSLSPSDITKDNFIFVTPFKKTSGSHEDVLRAVLWASISAIGYTIYGLICKYPLDHWGLGSNGKMGNGFERNVMRAILYKMCKPAMPAWHAMKAASNFSQKRTDKKQKQTLQTAPDNENRETTVCCAVYRVNYGNPLLNHPQASEIFKYAKEIGGTKAISTLIEIQLEQALSDDLAKMTSSEIKEVIKEVFADNRLDSEVIKLTKEAESTSNTIPINYLTSVIEIRELIELYPLVKYLNSNVVYPLVENYLPESLQNITFLEISNTMLITAHMSIGHLYAWQQPQGNVPFYIVESVAKSGSFAARLGVTKFINDYRDALSQNEQTITTTESLKHCASTLLTYTVPDLLICVAAKAAMPGYKCSDMNLGAKLSFAGSECYWSFKASQEPIEQTTADIVVPYIADLAAGITAYANGCGLMSVMASVVAADWMSKMVMDGVPNEIKVYADLALDSTVEFVTAKVLGSYSFVFENQSVN